ncbi:Flp/Fap pilin component [compost metagenome]
MSLTTFLNKIKKFVHNKDGASGIEYAILAAVVAVAIVAASDTVKLNLTNAFAKVATAITTVD